MDIYTTEEQQLDTFRQWWKDNGRAVIIGAVLGLGGLYGWRYWQSHQHGNFTAMSAEYEQVQNELNTDNAKALQDAQTFISANPETSYGVFSALDLSKKLIEKGDFSAAEKQL
ncbi:MAG: YfgM family protein, partial [Plesiomonas sp.]